VINIQPTKVILVEERQNPSTDYFILPLLATSSIPVYRYNLNALPTEEQLSGALVLFVRYISFKWRLFISRHRDKILQIAYFMDDDLLDISATSGLPLYRIKMARLAALHKNWLVNQNAHFWFSNAYLQQKYNRIKSCVINPKITEELPQSIRIFYHGSSNTHKKEIDWLYSIVDRVLKVDPLIAFEIIGNDRVFKQYKSLPRTYIVNPMSWSAYQHFISMPGRSIGLVPSMGTAFERARSYTKFFDITRTGAVGIYSSNSACADVVQHGYSGLIVSNDINEWINTILSLAHDPDRRQTLYEGALAASEKLSDRALSSYKDLI